MRWIIFLLSFHLWADSYTATCPSPIVTGQYYICALAYVGGTGYFVGNTDVTMTPSSGITFGPISASNTVTTSAQPTLTFWLKATSTGSATLSSFSNSGGLTNPGTVSITVNSPGSPPTFPPSLTPALASQNKGIGSTSTNNLSISLTPTSGNTVIVGVWEDAVLSGDTGAVVTDNLGDTFVKDAFCKFDYSGTFQTVAMYHFRVGPGVTSITAARGNVGTGLGAASEWTNLDSNPLDVADNACNDLHFGNYWIPGPMVTANDHDLVIGFGADSDTGTPTPGAYVAPWSVLTDISDTTNGAGATAVYQVVSSPGLQVPDGCVNPSPGPCDAAAPSGHYAIAIAAAYKAALSGTSGQSLVITHANHSTSVAVPVLTQTQDYRAEFQLHNITFPATTASAIWDMNDIGASAQLQADGHTLRINDKLDSVSPSVCDLDLTGITNALVRVMRNHTGTFGAEVWNWDSTHYNSCTSTFSSGSWPSVGGGVFGDSGGDSAFAVDIGFYKVFDTLLPLGSQPPVTATLASCSTVCTNLTFNSATVDVLPDTSGNGHDVTWPTAPTLASTPNQSPVALIKTANAPSWSQQVSFRAGMPGQLNCGDSYSLAEASAAVSCFWQVLAAPTMPFLSSHTSTTPTLTGMTFGNHTVQLQVTDVNNSTALSTLDVGAVATDSNGVVVQANPAGDQIFGPMIAFGQNPWDYQDYSDLSAANFRSAAYAAVSPPSWVTSYAGTVSYWPFYSSTPNQTTTTGSILATDLAIPIADKTKLDLSTFPTIVQVGPIFGNVEEVEVCGKTDGAGVTTTLNVCYNGRGWWKVGSAPQPFSSGTTVTQIKITGSGTHFLNGDSSTPFNGFCPAGPGEEGQIIYSTGTVGVNAGSPTLTGNLTVWTSALISGRVRVAGTYSSGTPFVFFADVSSVNSGTSITMSKPWPADADTGLTGLSYAIMQQGRGIALNWLRADSSTGQQLTPVTACFSDAAVYSPTGTGIGSNNIAQQTAQNFSFVNANVNWMSESGAVSVGYYDEMLANYAGYFRSGLKLFLGNARKIGDYWAKMPFLDEGYIQSTPRHQDITGLTAAAVLDGRVNNWTTIRNMASTAVTSSFSAGAINSPCFADTREQAYGLSWLALAALYDPVDTGNPLTPGQKSYWNAQLANAYTRDNGCQTGGEFKEVFYNGTAGTVTLTTGTQGGTGSGLSASMCNVAGTGTISVTHGLNTASGTGFINPMPAGGQIVIKGACNTNCSPGFSYRLFYATYTYVDSTHVTLQGTQGYDLPWPWDTGTNLSYQIENDMGNLTFATDITDLADQDQYYACTWVDSGHITLDRNWAGGNGAFNATRAQGVGHGAQPFMLGIKSMAMRFAGLTTSSAASNYQTLSQSTANWVLTKGFDPVTGGLYYARDFYGCEPISPLRMSSPCSYGPALNSQASARILSAEAQNAMGIAYLANPTSGNLAFGDQFYSAQWCNPAFKHPIGFTCDSAYFQTQAPNWQQKWYGFAFGIGMSHQWPAIRQGGVQSQNLVTHNLKCNLAAVPNATQVKLAITAPSGASSTVTCGSCPCSFQVDTRQGAHLVQVDYWSSSALLAPGMALPVQ